MQALADQVLRHDLLSPTLRAALGPDLLQRFLPFPINRFDRARALEQALEEAWRDATGSNLMALPLGALRPSRRSGAVSGSVPALLLSATDVDTGQPITVDQIAPPPGNETELRLSTAAMLSARFPVITPAGLASDGRRFVDGGYFDNSGASALLAKLQANGDGEDRKIDALVSDGRELTTAGHQRFEIILLRIGSIGTPGPPPSRALGELMSPLRALMNGREARGRIAEEQLESSVAVQHRVVPMLLCDDRARVPLGWLLAERSRRVMRNAIHDAQPCIDSPSAPGSNAAGLHAVMTKLSSARSTAESVNGIRP